MKVKILILLMLQFATCMVAKSDDGDNGGVPIIIVPGSGNNKPKTPDYDFKLPVCYYDGQNITIWFDNPEGNATVTITNNGNVAYHQATTNYPISIYVGNLSSGATIVIDTDCGNSYIAVYI